MAISLKELINNPERINELKLGNRCSCGSDELPHPDEVQYRIGEKIACADCYFEKFGEGIEEHPIGHPGTHRGH